VIRYADDLIALCHTQRQAEQVKAKLAQWLAPRGLVFNEDMNRPGFCAASFLAKDAAHAEEVPERAA